MVKWCVDCKTSFSTKYCYACGKEGIPYHLECPYCRASTGVLSKFCGECAKPVQEAVIAHINKYNGGGGENGSGNRDDAG